MKFSKDNTPLLVGLFVLAAIIIALIVYYTRPGETKTSEQTSDTTTELKIENLTLSRTLNPDPSVSSGTSGYTIEPYGVEYLTGDAQYKTLSKNVTFTMNWTNSPGFTGVVKGFKIEHYVKPDPTDTVPTPESVKKQDLIKKTTAVSPEIISILDFGECTAKIVSDGTYLVIGQNSFKLYAVVQKDDTPFDWDDTNTQKLVELYDGTAETIEPTELKIERDQLSATLEMTSPDTVSYTPETIEGTTTSRIIDKYPYKITNNAATLNIENKGVYLTLIQGTMGKYFNFTYEDGDYLLDDLTKGAVTTSRSKFKFEIVDKVGSVGKIREVGTTTTPDSNSRFLSSDGTTLKLYTKTDSALNATKFAGFNWTFVDWEEPVDCIGGWVVEDNGLISGTKKEKYGVTQQPINGGAVCKDANTGLTLNDGDIKTTLVNVPCQGSYSNYSECHNPSKTCGGTGTQTRTYSISQYPKNSPACPPSPDSRSCDLKSCSGGYNTPGPVSGSGL
jgi:hypothetical protein